MSIQQLIKKHPLTEDCRNIYPRTWIEAVKDKLTDISLDEILAAFNMLYLPYIGSREDTRLQVPRFLRRKGLWITYVDYDDKIRTEWYRDNHLSDEHWQSDIHWNVVLDMSDLLNQYFGSDAFHNIFVSAVKNAIKNMIDQGVIYDIIKQIIDSIDITDIVQGTINNYLSSDEFNNTLRQTLIDQVNQYLQDNIDMDEVNRLIQEYINSIDIGQIIRNELTNWFNSSANQQIILDLFKPLLDEKFEQLREELQQWCVDTERVIANALVRHEQWIQEHSET